MPLAQCLEYVAQLRATRERERQARMQAAANAMADGVDNAAAGYQDMARNPGPY
jgi:hypothetical protein